MGCHAPPPGVLPDLGIEPMSLILAGGFFITSTTWEAHYIPCAVLCCAVLLLSCLVMSNSLCPMDCSRPGSSVHGDSPGKNTRVGCHTLLQGTFPTQGSNPGLLHYRHILYHLSHQGSPRILGVGSPSLLQGIFSTWVSCIACRFFTS